MSAHATQDVAAYLKRQSQAFSDASASGNRAVLDRLLDERVAFMNENGVLSSKRDIVDGAGPPPSGVSNTLEQTGWHVDLHGSVAVTSFTDVSTARFHGQTLKSSFRSIEVWLDENGRWRMISSQTLAVLADPPAVALPVSVLDEYVGRYRAGPGYDITIARSGTNLTGSVNGGPPSPIAAEVRDVLFVPGQPRVRRIIQRSAAGTVTGFVSRREGHDIVFRRLA